MESGLPFSSSLEAALAKLRRREESLWGRLQSFSHESLLRLETSAFVLRYRALLKNRSLIGERSDPAIDLNPLLLFSLLFHLLLLFLVGRITFSPSPQGQPEPILVRILDLGQPSQEAIKKPKRARQKIAQPKPTPSPPKTAAEQEAPVAPPKPVPLLPAPKVLAEAPRERESSFRGVPAESLTASKALLPGGSQGSPTVKASPPPGTGVDVGITVPQGLMKGEVSQKTGKGGSGSVAALSSPDFTKYLERIKRKVQAVWQYPEGITGTHQVNLLFVLDRGGKLVRVELLDSSDSKLNGSALEAMKRASPFDPIPDSLKELAGWPLRMRFNIDFGVKAAR